MVAVGKPLKLWATTSEVDPSGRLNFRAKPRGLAPPAVSGMVGMPVKSENLTSTGIDLAENSLAALRLDAPALGSNTPTAMMPLACTAREWLSPKAL